MRLFNKFAFNVEYSFNKVLEVNIYFFLYIFLIQRVGKPLDKGKYSFSKQDRDELQCCGWAIICLALGC